MYYREGQQKALPLLKREDIKMVGIVSHNGKIYYQSLSVTTILMRCEPQGITINKKVMGGFSSLIVNKLCKLLETDRKTVLQDIRDGKIIKIENLHV